MHVRRAGNQYRFPGTVFLALISGNCVMGITNNCQNVAVAITLSCRQLRRFPL